MNKMETLNMEVPVVTAIEFLDFFEAADEHFSPNELVFFDGCCVGSDVDDLENWIFTLVNEKRDTHLFVLPQVAFYFIHLALSNVSPLPNSISTDFITCSRLKFICTRYKLQHLTALYPYSPREHFNNY